ncbi:triose-phosphate isomerase [Elioraea rosea]|uniref:triose-phosphate isomerase n=1 Tax=Elioraea rosea TaxID=2492390 RepID=UPI001185A53E|nr:triose-phosphate isomerase [Elioraea rosea]
MGKALIAGNWKMNGLAAQAEALALAVREGAAEVRDRAEILICPPATVLAMVARAMRGGPVMVGGQDCHMKGEGAHTGDISAEMLKDAGASHVIVGHSERRTDHGETNAMVMGKARMAMNFELRPILCIGETLAEREQGRAREVVQDQMSNSIPDGFEEAGGIVAYEPVWAIGTGRTASEDEIAEMHSFIRSLLGSRRMASVPILYGGSVKPANARAILALPEVGGALVGGASLVAADFLAIAAAAP